MIRIITVGKLKEDYLKDAKDEYLKRLGKYTKIEIIEVEDSKIDQENIALEEEKDRILKNILPKSYIITLEIDGKELSSIELSNLIDKIQIEYSDITFIIGGSYGIHKDIKEKANYHLSFSDDNSKSVIISDLTHFMEDQISNLFHFIECSPILHPKKRDCEESSDLYEKREGHSRYSVTISDQLSYEISGHSRGGYWEY